MPPTPEAASRPRIPLLGTWVDPLTFDETLGRIEGIIGERRPTQHVVLNAAKVVALDRDPDLRQIVDRCGLINADGTAVVWAARLLGRPLPERVTGIDLMHALLERADRRGWGVYFLGARPEVVRKVAGRVGRELPGVRIAGWRDGYFSGAQSPGIVRTIAASGADILLVALPSPRKEIWLQENLVALGVPFCMGVGGSFDVYAGVVRRAPRWLQRIGLEWAFRLLQEPRRLWRRYLITNVRFVALLGRALWRGGAGG